MLKLYCCKNTGPIVVNISDEMIASGIVCLDSSKCLRIKSGEGDLCHDENGKWHPVPGECRCFPKAMTAEQWASALAQE